MINVCEDELICDFAETYGILDYRALPVKLAASLCMGLRSGSRVRMRLRGATVTLETQILAMVHDWTALAAWLLSSNGQKGTNRDIQAFASGADFEAERERIIRGITNG